MGDHAQPACQVYVHPSWPRVSEPLEGADLRVLSLGAGVQSTTLALMAVHGEIGPMPDVAVFADTEWEPEPVYEHLRWLMSGNILPFPVHRVSAVNLRQQVIDRGGGRAFHFAPLLSRQRGHGSQTVYAGSEDRTYPRRSSAPTRAR